MTASATSKHYSYFKSGQKLIISHLFKKKSKLKTHSVIILNFFFPEYNSTLSSAEYNWVPEEKPFFKECSELTFTDPANMIINATGVRK